MTTGDSTRRILEGLSLASKAMNDLTFMELLTLTDTIPVDVPPETPVINYLTALHKEKNEDVARRLQTRLKQIADESERQAQRNADGGS